MHIGFYKQNSKTYGIVSINNIITFSLNGRYEISQKWCIW